MPVCRLNEQSLARFERHLSRCRRTRYSHAKRLSVVRGARLFLTYLRDVRIITLSSVKGSRSRSVVGLLSVDASTARLR
jgi:integrase/recombinase XerD